MNLIMLVGIVGSGKSTVAAHMKNLYERNGEPVVVVSSDAIREELLGDINDQTANGKVFEELRRKVNNNIHRRHVIVDATNINVKSRRSILDVVRNVENCHKVAMIVTTPLAICKKQNATRSRVVPEHVIDRQVRQFEIPFYEEGFDEITLVGWNFNYFETIVPSEKWDTDDDYILTLMKGFDQKTHHHKYPLDEHCLRCACEVKKRKPEDKVLYRAALIHDIGKLSVGEPKNDGSGDYRYYGHHNYGTYELLQNLDCIGFTQYNDILKCLFYVNFHMLPFFLESEKARKKWENIMGKENLNTLMLFNECDIIASGTRSEETG